MKSIVLAGGCFWGVEAYFKQLSGVKDTTVGYIDGKKAYPTYEEVCRGSGHAEAVEIVYDNQEISLKKVLDHLFNIIDPTLMNRQGPDIRVQYRSGIYNFDVHEEAMIKDYLTNVQKQYKKPLHVQVLKQATFYPAEAYHQDYLDKNKNGYCHVNLQSYKNVE